MVDLYFRRPVLIDFIVSIAIVLSTYFLFSNTGLHLPSHDVLFSLTGDLSTVALTFSGFILTLLTILITFKTSAQIPTDETQHIVPLFDIFFATPLYFKTITILKNAIKSLICIAMVGYSLKLVLHENAIDYLFYFDIGSIIVITLTLWRNLTVLGLIMKLQQNRNN
jgi:hypothetical protein